MASPPSATSSDRLLHCSPARLLVERRDADTSGSIVVKVFLAGALADAERELAFGQLAAGPGVVEHLRAGLDGATNRPCVVTRYEPGVDLARWVADRGALPAADACDVLVPVAQTLARLHTLRRREAPRGLCHGDVKPANLLRTATTTLLLDFEHAHAIGGATGPVGTVGFADPAAGRGTTAGDALDVHALGATLAWLVGGGTSRRTPCAPALAALIAACRHADPGHRPDAATVATRLEQLAAALRADPAETLLQQQAAGVDPREVPPAHAADPRLRAVRRRSRLAARVPHVLATPAEAPAEPAAVAAALARVQRVLDRFPRHAGQLRWRSTLRAAGAAAIANAPRHVAELVRHEAFDEARAWLDGLAAVVHVGVTVPGGLPLPATPTAGLAGAAQRDPLSSLQRLQTQVDAAAAELRRHVDAVLAAESRLDLRGAEAAVDAMASDRGGTSPTAARQRDRLHRLGFYLDRVARAEPNVERMTPLWDAAALQPLTAFVAAATRARLPAPRQDGLQSPVGLRSLQLTLASLADEFPHVPQVAPALDAHAAALAHLADHAWQLLGTARQQLQAVPVPVRPLSLALGRLDTLRILDAFVDRPQRLRSQLLDEIETLRLALEQARATRDRLAESAENALARGHWTTGLFDMERAVAGLAPAGDDERDEADRLRRRLQQARERKQEVEAAVRRNVELASLYGTLQDEPASTFAARLQVLEERRDCLLFLTIHVPVERSVLYRRDLRDVDTHIALERAALAEHRLDATVDPVARLRLVRATLDELSASVTQSEQALDPPGRVVRVLDHWRTVASHCQRAVEQLHAERASRVRQRARVVLVAVAAAVLASVAATFVVRPWFQGQPAAAATLPAGR